MRMSSGGSTLCFARSRRFVGLLLSGALLAASVGGVPRPALAQQGTEFTFYGQGRGHGLGMSQYGAKALAEQGWTYNKILQKFFPGTQTRAGSYGSQEITVCLNASHGYDFDFVRVRALNGGATVTDAATGKVLSNLVAGREVVIDRDGNGRFTVSGVSGTFSGPIRVQPVSEETRLQLVEYEGRRYRGRLEVLADPAGSTGKNICGTSGTRGTPAGSVRVLNRLSLDDYLKGIVEMPAYWPQEALKAQAVAARTFAVNRIVDGKLRSIDDGVTAQVYRGVEGEKDEWVSAVETTRGVIVTYNGTAIAAQYHSHSGGHTESVSIVWGSPQSTYPYLKGVPVPEEPLSLWSVSFTGGELEACLNRDSRTAVGADLFGLQVGAPIGVSGRPSYIRLFGAKGVLLPRADTFRFVCGPSTIRSTKFDLISQRLAGSDRFETAARIALAGWDPDTTDTVIIASGLNFPDALAASALSGLYDAPLLLTWPDQLPDVAEDAINHLRPKIAWLIGSEAVVSRAVANRLRALNISPFRLAGPNRFQTAAEVAEHVYAKTGTREAFIVTGLDFPDALSIASLAAQLRRPILLVRRYSIPPETRALLQKGYFNRLYVVGGVGAVDRSVRAELKRYASEVIEVTPDSPDRYTTNHQVHLFFAGAYSGDDLVAAIGTNFPDAMAAGPFAGKRKSPLVLVPVAGRATIDHSVASLVPKMQLPVLDVIGSPGVLPDAWKTRLEVIILQAKSAAWKAEFDNAAGEVK